MKTKLVDHPSTCMRFQFRKLHIHSRNQVKFVFKLQYNMHRARLAVGRATKAATLAIRAMLTCSHHLLRTTGANLDLRTAKSADLCHDYLGSRSNIQKGSKTFSLEFPAPSFTLPPESRLQQKVQNRRSGLRQGKRVHPIVIGSWVKGRTFDI
jgi:hypothetical protein